jgi:hypothetical protein
MTLTDRDLANTYRKAWFRLAVPWGFYEEVFDRSLHQNAGIALEQFGGIAEQASAILSHHGAELVRSFCNVTAVALSLRYRLGEIVPYEPCITFFVSAKLPPYVLGTDLIPPMIEGVPTDVVEAGAPELHMATAGHTPGVRLRPIEPGVSVSHFRVSSGSFGCLVEDDEQQLYILSCAHVLSDPAGLPGDPVVQPGASFGGVVPVDQTATFTKSIPLSPGACIADAAIAKIAEPATATPVIRYIGVKPAATRALSAVGVLVQKSGDQTGLTHGVVVGIKGTIGPYNANGVNNIYFTDAIVTSGMSADGDSGSLLMDYNSHAIGLLFGGLKFATATGSVSYVVSWSSPIDVVLRNLGVHLAP